MRQLNETTRDEAAQVKEWAGPNTAASQVAYFRSINQRVWHELSAQAGTDLAARRADLKSMARRQERVASLLQQTDELKVAARAIDSLLPARLPRAKLRAHLEPGLKDRGLSPTQISKALSLLASTRPRQVVSNFTNSLTRSVELLDTLARTQMACLMGALIAKAVAEFNNGVENPATDSKPPRTRVEKLWRQVQSLERSVWMSLKAERYFAASAFGDELARVAESAIIDAAIPQVAALAATRRTARGSSRQIDSRALEGANVIRRLLRACALGTYVGWVSNWMGTTEGSREWARAAQTRAFRAERKAPAPVSISALVTRPARFEGRRLTVEGNLGQVTIRHRRGAYDSSALLSDAAGNSMALFIPYIKMDSGGMSAGSRARVSGVWRSKGKHFDAPALYIDRRSLRETGRSNWTDWASLRIGPIFEETPHGIEGLWTWEPDIDGAVNPIRYGTWFRHEGGPAHAL